MPQQIKNNFAIFKADFKKDTGLDFSPANMNLYVAYYNARVTDQFCQYSNFFLQNIASNTRLNIKNSSDK
jgi:hypothetical protein